MPNPIELDYSYPGRQGYIDVRGEVTLENIGYQGQDLAAKIIIESIGNKKVKANIGKIIFSGLGRQEKYESKVKEKALETIRDYMQRQEQKEDNATFERLTAKPIKKHHRKINNQNPRFP